MADNFYQPFLNMLFMQQKKSKRSIRSFLLKAGIGGFIFFLLKGLIWLILYYFFIS
jgi:hypothetical protein